MEEDKKKLKELFKKLQKDPKMMSMINKMNSMSNTNKDDIPQEKLKKILDRFKTNRLSSNSKKFIKEKQEEKIKDQQEKIKTKDDQTLIDEANTKINTEINKAKKNKKKHLNKLKKKYGNITDEQYFSAVNTINTANDDTPEDLLDRSRNIVYFYHIQQKQQNVEKNNPFSDSESESES